ncbi:MAG: FAD-binding oxidoreductase [Candidatus Eremiobacteraeota bacterium]|nr:FAD-binding oxidoreductase [Candidatus Eremiobacteraeota bacterium]
MIAPKSVVELAALIADHDRARRTVAIEGGNTLHEVGSPSTTDTTLSTTALNAVVAHEPADLTVASQAGMTVANFLRRLAEHKQFVPIDAPHLQAATLGGTLASGWLGPRRHLFGRPRDYVIGSQTVLASGSIVNAGGMVVKNVTGYDMSKLYIGAFGTLGIFTQLNFKTLPKPSQARVLIASLPERTASRAAEQIAALDVRPAAAFCIEGFRTSIDGEDGIDGRIFALFEGSAQLIERATRDLRSALGKAGVPQTTIVDSGASESFDRVVDSYIAGIGERSITYRALGLPESARTRALALRDLAHRQQLFTDLLIDLMNGDVILRVSDPNSRTFAGKIEDFDEALHTLAPNAAIICGPSLLRERLSVWGELPNAIEKMRALKRQFDPNRTLNPGRYIGNL